MSIVFKWYLAVEDPSLWVPLQLTSFLNTSHYCRDIRLSHGRRWLHLWCSFFLLKLDFQGKGNHLKKLLALLFLHLLDQEENRIVLKTKYCLTVIHKPFLKCVGLLSFEPTIRFVVISEYPEDFLYMISNHLWQESQLASKWILFHQIGGSLRSHLHLFLL